MKTHKNIIYTFMIALLCALLLSACAEESVEDPIEEPIDGLITEERGSAADYTGWWEFAEYNENAPFSYVKISEGAEVHCYDEGGVPVDDGYLDYSEQRALNGNALIVFIFDNIGEYAANPYTIGDDMYLDLWNNSDFEGKIKLDRSGALDTRFSRDNSAGSGITQEILFDFSCGSPEENIRRETHYSNRDVTAEEIIGAMSDMSGLDFFATVSETGDGVTVDWAADSTLVAGLDDREQKEEFFFYDADSLRWFMMDSMWQTMKSFFLAEEIFYTMDGGKKLAFDELYPVNAFPSDLPYMGSAFFFAHANEADIIGDSSDMDGEGAGEDEAMDILVNSIDMAEGTAIVPYGEDVVDGVHCWIFAYGKNTPEKFTAETHYAVTDDGAIYVLDILSNQYIPFAWQRL